MRHPPKAAFPSLLVMLRTAYVALAALILLLAITDPFDGALRVRRTGR